MEVNPCRVGAVVERAPEDHHGGADLSRTTKSVHIVPRAPFRPFSCLPIKSEPYPSPRPSLSWKPSTSSLFLLAKGPMNSLYTLGVRQTNSIQADLERLRTGDASASLLGLSPILILFPSTPPHPPSNPGLQSSFLEVDALELATAYRSAFPFVSG